MDSKTGNLGLLILLTGCLFLTAVIPSYSEGPRESKQLHGMNYERASGEEEGLGGASGQIAAWFFGIANFPIVVSILLKACGKVAPQGSNLKEAVSQINRRQKRYLMKLHYWLNPAAVGIAIIHCLSTKCDATAIPEIGLGVMLLVCILGIIVAFQWSPAFMRKAIFRLHTSSVLFVVSISILLIGHSMVD
jgi:hypothetical protein